MKLQDLKPQLLSLTPQEKAEAIQFLSQSLVNSWQGIEKTAGVCGGKACGSTKIVMILYNFIQNILFSWL